MTTKHTPGPWVRDTGSGFGCDVRAESGRKVAATWGINNGDPHRPAYRAECNANARLIAAAPNLLDACMAMIEWDDREKDHAVDFNARMDLCRAAFDKARAAIAKAKGEQQ